MDKSNLKAQTAYVASKELSDKVKKIQNELNLKTPGEVISMALSLLELSLGREVELKEKDKIFKTRKFAKYNQTVILDDVTDQ